MSVYSETGLKLYSEAVRVVPGLIAAKERKAPKDAQTLFEGYMALAKEQHVSEGQAWSILFNAAIHWVHQLAKVRAQDRSTEIFEIINDMGAVAAVWEPK